MSILATILFHTTDYDQTQGLPEPLGRITGGRPQERPDTMAGTSQSSTELASEDRESPDERAGAFNLTSKGSCEASFGGRYGRVIGLDRQSKARLEIVFGNE